MHGYDFGRELLKWLAIKTMTIDHVGAVLYTELDVLRLIGRISFPLFAYLLILGIENTKNVYNYFIRLFIFALISQVPFFFAVGYDSLALLNIFFTLSFGLLFIHFLKRNSIVALVPLLGSVILPIDYGVYGIVIIGCMFILRSNIKLGIVSLILVNSLFLVPFNSQFLSIGAIPFLLIHKIYSQQKKKETRERYSSPWWRKYFFYLYYPLHLGLLYVIKLSWF